MVLDVPREVLDEVTVVHDVGTLVVLDVDTKPSPVFHVVFAVVDLDVVTTEDEVQFVVLDVVLDVDTAGNEVVQLVVQLVVPDVEILQLSYTEYVPPAHEPELYIAIHSDCECILPSS